MSCQHNFLGVALCEHCGEDEGALLRSRLADAETRVAILESECASMSEELLLPPTIRPAEGELRRMMLALGRVAELESVLLLLIELVEVDPEASDPATDLYVAVRRAEVALRPPPGDP